jgi:hypothetical protein
MRETCMKRLQLQAVDRRNKKPLRDDIARPFDYEIARLFDRFKLDIERMFGLGRTTTADPMAGQPQRGGKKRASDD